MDRRLWIGLDSVPVKLYTAISYKQRGHCHREDTVTMTTVSLGLGENDIALVSRHLEKSQRVIIVFDNNTYKSKLENELYNPENLQNNHLFPI